MLDVSLLHVPRMSTAAAAGLLVSLVGVYVVAWIVYTRFFHPLAGIPGPFWASVTRFWTVREVFRGQTEKTQKALHDRLGPIIRIGPNEVAISDPEAIKIIYGINSGFTKTDFYPLWAPRFSRYPDHFSNLDEKLHASRRRITNNLYSMSSISRSEESINVCMDVLLKKMASFARSGEAVDLAVWSQLFAFDVVGELFFSRSFGFLEAGGDHRGYIRSLDLLLPFMTAASCMPTYLRTLFLAGGALGHGGVRKAMLSMQDIETAAETCVAERDAALREGRLQDEKDILASLFATMHEKGEKLDFGRTEVKTEVFTALFAGSDTTAAATSSVFYHLMRNRAAYDKLTAEIDAATADGRLSMPYIKYKEGVALPYLDACLKEGMRLHPSVGMTLPRHVPAGGCQISGVYFPEGTRVGVNAAIMHLDRAVFGDDAAEFVPERWFRPEASNMDRYMFQFGAGSRTCIGKNISLCEMYKMIPQLLRSFHLELVHPERQWTTHNYWFNKPSRVDTRLTARR